MQIEKAESPKENKREKKYRMMKYEEATSPITPEWEPTAQYTPAVRLNGYKEAFNGGTYNQITSNFGPYVMKRNDLIYEPKETSCIQLQESEIVATNKRKYSEMVRLDNAEKQNDSPFDIPSSKQTDFNCRIPVKNLEDHIGLRKRNNTEVFDEQFQDLSPANANSGFKPTKDNNETLSCIQLLRDKYSPKPNLNRVLSFRPSKQSIDSVSQFSNHFQPSAKRVNIVLLKMDKDSQDVSQDFYFKRSRLQTF